MKKIASHFIFLSLCFFYSLPSHAWIPIKWKNNFRDEIHRPRPLIVSPKTPADIAKIKKAQKILDKAKKEIQAYDHAMEKARHDGPSRKEVRNKMNTNENCAKCHVERDHDIDVDIDDRGIIERVIDWITD